MHLTKKQCDQIKKNFLRNCACVNFDQFVYVKVCIYVEWVNVVTVCL